VNSSAPASDLGTLGANLGGPGRPPGDRAEAVTATGTDPLRSVGDWLRLLVWGVALVGVVMAAGVVRWRWLAPLLALLPESL